MDKKLNQIKAEEYYQNLSGQTLSKASRSFYISFKFLPNGLKRPVCLFYLIGRALDDITDSQNIPADKRLQALIYIKKIIHNEAEISTLQPIINNILPYFIKNNERDLVNQLPNLLHWLELMPEKDKNEIKKIQELIITGDEFDLNRFGNNVKLTSIKTEKELMEYCFYQAAGIAEIANKIFFRHVPHYALLPEDKMSTLAYQGGMGIQLINILRDLPADLKEGRCYIPEEELKSVDLTANEITNQTEKLIPILNKWHQKIINYLDESFEYVSSINNRRIKYGTIIAFLVCVKTVILLKNIHYIKANKKVKVGRSQIKKIMAISLLCLISKKYFHSYYQSLRELASTEIILT